MTVILKRTFTLIFGFILFGCNSDPVVPAEEKYNNLIENYSFEHYGKATLDGWNYPPPPLLKFSADVPPFGEKYSIFLKSFEIGGIISTSVSAPAGTNSYIFSFWGKVNGSRGLVELFLNHSGSLSLLTSIQVKNLKWNNFVFKDTLATVAGDSLTIKLSGAYYQSPQPYVWFDVCKLEVKKINL